MRNPKQDYRNVPNEVSEDIALIFVGNSKINEVKHRHNWWNPLATLPFSAENSMVFCHWPIRNTSFSLFMSGFLMELINLRLVPSKIKFNNFAKLNTNSGLDSITWIAKSQNQGRNKSPSIHPKSSKLPSNTKYNIRHDTAKFDANATIINKGSKVWEIKNFNCNQMQLLSGIMSS